MVCHTQPVNTGTPAVFGRREKGGGVKIKITIIAALIVLAVITSAMGGKYQQEPERSRMNFDAVECRENVTVTVIYKDRVMLKYTGNAEIWKGEDEKACGIIYFTE